MKAAIRTDELRVAERSIQNNIYREPGGMKLLLTSSGISNTNIHDALVDLLGKPIAESARSASPLECSPSPADLYTSTSSSAVQPILVHVHQQRVVLA